MFGKNIVIASLVAPNYVGGLSAYSRMLADGLEKLGNVQTNFACVDLAHPSLPSGFSLSCSARSLISSRRWRFLRLNVFNRMASRPILHSLLERVLGFVLPDSRLESAIGTPNVVHFVGTGWDFLGFRLLQYARRVDALFTILPAIHPESWGNDVIDLRLYRRCDTVFCLSNHEATYLHQRGVHRSQIAHCGIPPASNAEGNARRFRETYELASRPTVLFVGRREEGKGYSALLKSWVQVLASVPTAVLLLAGPGGQEFDSFRVDLPSESFRDLGIPNDQTKADALAACDVFCLPSAHESFGIAYVEAWSHGKPVICGTAPACRELIEDGITGLWADQELTTLAEKLTSLLTCPEKARVMGQAGYALQRSTYTEERMLRKHLDAWGMLPSHELTLAR